MSETANAVGNGLMTEHHGTLPGLAVASAIESPAPSESTESTVALPSASAQPATGELVNGDVGQEVTSQAAAAGDDLPLLEECLGSNSPAVVAPVAPVAPVSAAPAPTALSSAVVDPPATRPGPGSPSLSIQIPPNSGTKRELERSTGSPLSPRKSKRMRTQTPKFREANEASMQRATPDMRATVLFTPTQASTANRQLPKGFKFVPVTFKNNADHAAFLLDSGRRSQRILRSVATPQAQFTPKPRKKKGKGGALSEVEAHRKMINDKINLLQRRLNLLKRRKAIMCGEVPQPVHVPRNVPQNKPPVTPVRGAPLGTSVTTPVDGTPSSRRSHRVVKKPKFLVEENLPKLSEPIRRCQDLLISLMRNQDALIFNEPVDPVALKLADYFTVIKQPMDLGTVKARLQARFYDNIHAFAADVRLIWANALKYNGKTHFVSKKAEAMSCIFEKKFANIPATPKARPKSKARKGGSETPGRKKAKGDQSSLNATLEALTKQVTSLQNAIQRQKPGARKTNKDNVPLNRREKEILRQNIFKLPSDKLGPVVEMCSEGNDGKGDDEEIEIDMEKLDTATLRRLQKYVVSVTKKTKKTPGRKTPGRTRTPGRPPSGNRSGGRRSTPSPMRRPNRNTPSPAMAIATSPGRLDRELGIGDFANTIAASVAVPSKEESDGDSSDSSSSSSSSGSDSSDDEDVPQKKKKKKVATSKVPRPAASPSSFLPSAPPPSFGDPSGMYSVGSTMSGSGGPIQGSGHATNRDSKSQEPVNVNSSAWGNLGSDSTDTVEREASDNLWSSFQSQQQQQTEIEKEREAMELRMKEDREREAVLRKQQAEEARRRQVEEVQLQQQKTLQEESEAQRRREEEREKARLMRQQAAVLDLGEQSSMMDTMMNSFG